MTFKNYIESQYRELESQNLISIEFMELYKTVKYERLRLVLASVHKQFVVLFKLMNDRLPTKDHEAHFLADSSRKLIFAINIAMGLHRTLKKSEYAFEINDYYLKLLNKCESFLSNSGGSTIPENMDKITLYYITPIFFPSCTLKITRNRDESYQELKLIGEGLVCGRFLGLELFSPHLHIP